jgi:hypothetical protein
MKTAVEWLIDEHFGGIENCTPDFRNKIQQAKEMEKEQSLKKIIYDLDELASEYSEGKSTSEVFKRAHESDFKAGFQKAIELLTFKTTEQ